MNGNVVLGNTADIKNDSQCHKLDANLQKGTKYTHLTHATYTVLSFKNYTL